MRQAVEALYREVALIRKIAETSTDQSEEIRLLRETVARLRGSSVAAVQYQHHNPNGQSGQHAQNGQHSQNGTGQYPARASHRPASASSPAPGSRTNSAA
jgi:hypothetical protein